MSVLRCKSTHSVDYYNNNENLKKLMIFKRISIEVRLLSNFNWFFPSLSLSNCCNKIILLIGLQSSSLQRLASSASNPAPDDTFLEMLARCQGSRLEDQRSPLPAASVAVVDAEDEPVPTAPPITARAGATVPDEDFFTLIVRLQSGRMEDQRATISAPETR